MSDLIWGVLTCMAVVFNIYMLITLFKDLRAIRAEDKRERATFDADSRAMQQRNKRGKA